MSVPNTVADQVASVATYGGSGVAVAFGLTASQWSVVGVIGGLIVAVIGLIAKTVMDWHFRQQHLKLAQSRAAVLREMGEDE